MIKLTTSELQSSSNSELPILIDFFSPDCAPCGVIAKILLTIEDEFKDKIKFYSVDISEDIDLAVKFSVTSVPTLVFIKNGNIVNKLVGAQTESKIRTAIGKVV